MKMDYKLESKLVNMATKFEDLENELHQMTDVWDLLVTEYSCHPLQAIMEFIEDAKQGKFEEED